MSPARELPCGICISVGNITWGGTGKTPLVLHIANRNRNRTKVYILTRGYKNGDEAKMMKEKCMKRRISVLVGKDRLANATKAFLGVGEFGGCNNTTSSGASTLLQYVRASTNRLKNTSTIPPIIWILDDGMQHWAIKRDVEIVTMDCHYPFGTTGKLIPFGSLRELPQDGLPRADAVVLYNANAVPQQTLCELRAKVQSYCKPGIPIVHACARVEKSFQFKSNTPKQIVLVSGIGNNHAFAETVREILKPDMDIVETIEFMDHHEYSKQDLERIARANAGKTKILITTEKDAARCPDLLIAPIHAIALPIEWTAIGGDVEEFEGLLEKSFQAAVGRKRNI